MSDPAAAPRVALVVDNPYRDLPGLVLTAWRLCQSGVTCYLVPMNLSGMELMALAPDFVLLNYLRPNNETMAEGFQQAGIGFGVLDTEGGVLSSLDYYAEWIAQNPDHRARAAFYCTWGKKLAEFLVEKGWFSPDQIRETGTPQYDLYSKRWLPALRKATSFVDDMASDFILVNGNFTLANPCFKSPQEEIDVYVKTFGRNRGSIVAWQHAEFRTMHDLAQAVGALARRFPATTIVYRPHPFERVETYSEVFPEVFANLPNVRVIKKGSIGGWLARARAVIQCSCSTAIEATLLGVPVFNPAWIPIHVRNPGPDQVSQSCASIEDLTRQVDSVVKGTFSLPSQAAEAAQCLVEDWFYRIDGLAHDRLAGLIRQHLPERPDRGARVEGCRPFAYSPGYGTVSLRRKLRAGLLERARLPLHWSFRDRANSLVPDLSWWDKSDKSFRAADVQPWLDAICATHEGSGDLAVHARPAAESGAYAFGFRAGRAVELCGTA